MAINYNNVANKLFLGILLFSNTSILLIHATEEQTEQHVSAQLSDIDELNNLLDSTEPLPQSNPSNPANYTPAWVKSAALRVLSSYYIAREKMATAFKNVKLYITKK